MAIGSYPVTAKTNGEIVTLANAISVAAATPYLSNVAPNSGVQGAVNLPVVFTGVFTSFNVGSLSANFGPNITVNSVTPNGGSATSATANISIANTAATGGRSCALTSNGTIFNFTFTVTASNAALTSVTPTSGFQSSSVALQVTSANTHWVQGLTSAALGAGIVVNRVIVNSVTRTNAEWNRSAIAMPSRCMPATTPTSTISPGITVGAVVSVPAAVRHGRQQRSDL